MDFADFCKGAEVDDVLVQALFRQARLKLHRLVKTAESRYFLEQESIYREKARDNSASATDELSVDKAETAASEIAAALLEAELLEPFARLQRQEAALQQRYETYPVARSLRLATESAIFGLQRTINRGVQSLIEARNETLGDGHFDSFVPSQYEDEDDDDGAGI